MSAIVPESTPAIKPQNRNAMVRRAIAEMTTHTENIRAHAEQLYGAGATMHRHTYRSMNKSCDTFVVCKRDAFKTPVVRITVGFGPDLSPLTSLSVYAECHPRLKSVLKQQIDDFVAAHPCETSELVFSNRIRLW